MLRFLGERGLASLGFILFTLRAITNHRKLAVEFAQKKTVDSHRRLRGSNSTSPSVCMAQGPGLALRVQPSVSQYMLEFFTPFK